MDMNYIDNLKEYESPEMEIILVEDNDVIVTSIGGGIAGGSDDGLF